MSHATFSTTNHKDSNSTFVYNLQLNRFTANHLIVTIERLLISYLPKGTNSGDNIYPLLAILMSVFMCLRTPPFTPHVFSGVYVLCKKQGRRLVGILFSKPFYCLNNLVPPPRRYVARLKGQNKLTTASSLVILTFN